MQEEVEIKRHPVTAGFIGIVTVVYTYIVYILIMAANDAISHGALLGLMFLAPFVLVFGAVGGAFFFRSAPMVHQFWIAPLLMFIYDLTLFSALQGLR